MADNLRVFGNTYNNAVGVKLTDTNGNEVVYTAGGGSDVYVVHGTVTMGDTMTVSVENSIADIAAAVADKKALIATLIDTEGEYYTNLPLLGCELTDGEIDAMEFMMLSAFAPPGYNFIALTASRLIYDPVSGWRLVTSNFNVTPASDTT